MRLKVVLAAAVALAASVAFPTVASGEPGYEGLWTASSTGTATTTADCGAADPSRTVTADGFCAIDDVGGGVELGVKFTSSRAVLITGVRVYRVDAGSVTGSLWTAGGEKLADGAFPSYSGPGWQDLLFASPVRIEAGQTYIASYNAPSGDYAFEWYYFSDQSRTVGPITALQSAEADGNGVYCYVGEPCNLFPTNTSNDSNYWVTPLWSSYEFSGFRQPVDIETTNIAKAGSAIPVKFGLGGDMGLGILRDGYPRATRIQCESSEPTDAIENTLSSAASSGLAYDPATGQYTYVWKTSKSMVGSCYRFELGLDDGMSHTFTVQFKR